MNWRLLGRKAARVEKLGAEFDKIITDNGGVIDDIAKDPMYHAQRATYTKAAMTERHSSPAAWGIKEIGSHLMGAGILGGAAVLGVKHSKNVGQSSGAHDSPWYQG